MFRSPSVINRIIFETATIHGVPLVDIDRSFSNNSMHGIPGNNLFTGQGETTLFGNILIARECYKALTKGDYIKSKNHIEVHNFALTPFDSAYDRICSRGETSVIVNPVTSTTFEEKTVSLFASNKASWEEAMNTLYDFYISNKNYDMAFRIIENLALENPYNVSINNKASITASFLGDSQLVVHYAKKVYKVKPDYDIAQRIFLNYLKLDMPESALPYMEYALKNNLNGTDLSIIYEATHQVIDLKKALFNNPDDKGIRRQIANQYVAMGNEEIALRYTR
jgi:tetratricopeptide (TPR) repeat protein